MRLAAGAEVDASLPEQAGASAATGVVSPFAGLSRTAAHQGPTAKETSRLRCCKKASASPRWVSLGHTPRVRTVLEPRLAARSIYAAQPSQSCERSCRCAVRIQMYVSLSETRIKLRRGLGDRQHRLLLSRVYGGRG